MTPVEVAHQAANAARLAIDAPSAKTEPLLASALSAAEKLENSTERATVLLHIARTLMLRDKGQRSAEASLRLAQLLERVSMTATEAGGTRLRSYADGYRANLYEDAMQLDVALVLTDRALLSAATLDDPNLLAQWNAQSGRLLRALGRSDEAVTAYRHARGDLERLRPTMGVERFLERAQPIINELVDLLLLASAKDPKPNQAILSEAQSAVETLKAAELRDYFGDECLATQRRTELQKLPDSVVLYPILVADRVELLVASKGVLHQITSRIDRETLVEEVRRLNLRLQDPTSFAYRASAERLYDWLVRPIRTFINDQTTALVVVSSGSLIAVPMATLRDRENGQFLVEQVPIAITPSLQLTDPHPIDRSDVFTLAAGLTTSVDGLSSLTFAEQEISSVGSAFPSVELMGDQFTIEALEQTFDSRPFGIVHIASHGSFAEDSRQSFVMAHDGRVSMQRLAELVGRARFRNDTPLELLTLSACETAVGDNRALLGLAGIAIQAGARSALATLWRVNDEATAELMSVFYRELAKPGVSRARAVQRAQQSLLASERFRHPSFWAPFLIINSWL
jgi:CHAT domain-containing protein